MLGNGDKAKERFMSLPFFFFFPSYKISTETKCSVISLSIRFLEEITPKSSSLNLCNNISVKLLLWVLLLLCLFMQGFAGLSVSLVTSFQKIKYLLGATRLLPAVGVPTADSALSP